MIVKKIKEQVRKNPNKLAYINEYESITYKELYNRTLEVSLKIKDSNRPVIIIGDKSVNFLIVIVACLFSKKTYIPIDTSVPISRINYIKSVVGKSLIVDVSSSNIVFEEYDLFSNDFDNIAYIIFTSGTSGNPKGVPISYDNLNNFVNWISNIDGLKEFNNCSNLKVLNQASFSFDLSVTDMYYSLCNGHTLVALSNDMKNDYNRMINYIKDNDIDVIVCTPTFMKYCLVDSNFNESLFPLLKTIYFCGEVLEVSFAKKLRERFKSVNIINAYGPTEATSAVSSILVTNDMLNSDILPVGDVRTSAVKIEIENEEIVLKGLSVFDNYINYNSDSIFKEEGINCYRTGDIGAIKNNKIYCYGRSDSQIKYNGYRIELNDIENNMLKIKGINGAVVIAVYDDVKVKYLKAFVEVKDKKINSSYIKDELNKFVPKYMIPRKIIIIDKIPINNNGKYDRKLLKEYDKC